MKVYCETNHGRVPMRFEPSSHYWSCPNCPERIGDEAAWHMIPVPYRRASELGILHALDVSEIHVIIGGYFPIEYPRL